MRPLRPLLWFFLVLMTVSLTAANHPTVSWKTYEYAHAPHYKWRHNTPITKQIYDFWQPNLSPKRDPSLTPDWTIDEIPPEGKTGYYYGEFERPIRLQPMAIAAKFWDQSPGNFDHPQLLGCYCCTVYKMVHPLAGCAVLTTRHILTTATSTELVLKDHGGRADLRGILGAWYDITYFSSNDSHYMTPARIHYHPKYLMPENVNASHPIPGMFDLAVWASEKPFFRHISPYGDRQTFICNRAGSYWLQFGSPVLGAVKQPVAIIVGFQYIMWWKRKPSPFHKYAVKTQKYTGKCPKTEWGWFFCVWGRWAMHGLDSGAALHRATQGQSWLYDGLLGLNAFSMDLRAKELTHYFTPVENHSVLSWLYDAYMGRQDYRYLDFRFENSEWQSPRPKKGIKITIKYDWPDFPHEWDQKYAPPIFYK